MSESRTSSDHLSPLIATEWLHRQSDQQIRRSRTPVARISAKVIFWRALDHKSRSLLRFVERAKRG
jgi:hypothetical protein